MVVVNKAKYSGDNDADDYNDDSNMSDISDLSDVFKLNSDIMPEMQRSIDWVSATFTTHIHQKRNSSFVYSFTKNYYFHNF